MLCALTFNVTLPVYAQLYLENLHTVIFLMNLGFHAVFSQPPPPPKKKQNTNAK